MNRPPARPAALVSLMLALAAAPLTPVAAQQQSGSFSLPEPTPTPSPAPAGPADERAGVAIPPRAVPAATPTATPTPLPTAAPRPLPQPAPSATQTPLPRPVPSRPAPLAAPTREAMPANPLATPDPEPASPPGPIEAAPSIEPPLVPSAPTTPVPFPVPDPAKLEPQTAFPDWWPYAAGVLGALVLLGGGAVLWRRRRPGMPRLAAPVEDVAEVASAAEPPRLDLALEVISATRSLMMFTLGYRLTIANRSDRAVNDLALAVQLACARASTANAPANAPSPGSAQALAGVARIGPHQARVVTGTVQLPLSAVAPLRQGQTPLFVPLVHVTLEGEGQRALAKSFVIGTPSASGRVHPIPLDQPPGTIAGLVAQTIAVPPVPAAA